MTKLNKLNIYSHIKSFAIFTLYMTCVLSAMSGFYAMLILSSNWMFNMPDDTVLIYLAEVVFYIGVVYTFLSWRVIVFLNNRGYL